MKSTDIQKCIDAIQVALAAKGKSRADVRFTIAAHSSLQACIRWNKPEGDYEYEFFHGETFEETIGKADAFVSELPGAEETKFREFMASLGSVIELGRKNDIDDDFLNPLTEAMKQLSKNALTDQRAAA